MIGSFVAMNVSAVVLTYNEEINIGDCIESLKKTRIQVISA